MISFFSHQFIEEETSVTKILEIGGQISFFWYTSHIDYKEKIKKYFCLQIFQVFLPYLGMNYKFEYTIWLIVCEAFCHHVNMLSSCQHAIMSPSFSML